MLNQVYPINTAETGPATDIVAKLVQKVFGWMTLGLLVTAATSIFTLANPDLLELILSNSLLFYGLLILELITVVSISAAINKIAASAATGLFILYSVMNGLTLSVLFLVYTGASVASAFLVTAFTFGATALYGYVTKRDLTRISSLAMMGLFGIIIAMIANIFIQSDSFSFVISLIAIVVFVVLTAWDTQKIKAMFLSGIQDAEQERKMAILGALTLYLDFINLFINILRIMGRRR